MSTAMVLIRLVYFTQNAAEINAVNLSFSGGCLSQARFIRFFWSLGSFGK